MSDIKTATHKGKVYQIGGVYEFSDAGKDWAVDVLLSVGVNSTFPFEARQYEWELIREVNYIIGTIKPAPIELVNGAAYMFDVRENTFLGFYRERRKSFFYEIINGNKIAGASEATNIRLMTVESE